MQDRVYPSTKPPPPPPQQQPPINGRTGAPPSSTHTANGAPMKQPLPYNNLRRPHPPPPTRRRCTCRRFCCFCFLYTLITLLSLLLLAAIAACIFYFLYHPKHPFFSVSSLRISTFNLSSPTTSSIYPHVASRIDLTLTAKNPNTRLITFLYQPITVSLSAAGADLGNSSFPGFVSVPGNVTVLAATVASDPTKGQDPDAVNHLISDLGKKGGWFPVELEFDAEVKMLMGKLKSKNVGIRVGCSGIRGMPPSARTRNRTVPTPTLAGAAGAKCRVDLRLRIWKFTLF